MNWATTPLMALEDEIQRLADLYRADQLAEEKEDSVAMPHLQSSTDGGSSLAMALFRMGLIGEHGA
ncbi:MAG TPA: hypothetical protein VGS41_01730 [Chthonomonadales bacterium]|nr:hypothetical protein [Chthonomonadales bacterium]